MSLTIFGVIVMVVGLYLLANGSMVAMLGFVMVTTLFGGSAALSLPALGGSSIPPANLALLFMLARAVLPGPQQAERFGTGISSNIFLIIFTLYGSISAWILPRLFAGAIQVTPLRPGAVRQLFEAAPVHFSSQNITTSVYLLGTLISGVGSYIGAARQGSAQPLVRVGVVIAITHALLGFFSIFAAGTSLNVVVEFFRNGHYAQLDQSIEGLSRMNGIWPEASGFAAFGGTWLIFMTELWLRDVRSRATGFAAALLAFALLVSTSSTAYVTLAGYSTVLILRTIIVPRSMRFNKALTLLFALFFATVAVLAMVTFSATFFEKFAKIIAIMTVNKTESASGIQRLFWAKQGFEAFVASAGLGIGAGSFRSSSLITAIIGSMGVIGVATFVAHLARAFMPLRGSTYYADTHGATAVGGAAAWTCVLMLMPAAVSSPTPDPGVLWAMFAGLALGLRSAPHRSANYAANSPSHSARLHKALSAS